MNRSTKEEQHSNVQRRMLPGEDRMRMRLPVILELLLVAVVVLYGLLAALIVLK